MENYSFIGKRKISFFRSETIKLSVDSGNLSIHKLTRSNQTTLLASAPIYEVIFSGNKESAKDSKWIYISFENKESSKLYLMNEDKTLCGSYDSDTLDDDKCIRPSHDADMSMSTQTFRLGFKDHDLVKLYTFLESSGAVKATIKKSSGIFRSQYISYTNKWLFCFDGSNFQSVPIEEMAFFVKNGNNIYCGYHRQLVASVNKASFRNELRDYCYSISKRLQAGCSGISYTKGWFRPEIITLTDEGVIYSYKKFRHSEMCYVPYDRINLVSCTEGMFKKGVFLVGEQNIFPKNTFWRSTVSDLIKRIVNHNIPFKKGMKFSSSNRFKKNWFGKAPKLICFEDTLVYIPNRLDYDFKKCFINYRDILKVTWYKRLFRFYGNIELVVKATNIRRDQDGCEVVIRIPKLFSFRYKWFIFSGRLRRVLKKKTNAEFKRVIRKKRVKSSDC